MSERRQHVETPRAHGFARAGRHALRGGNGSYRGRRAAVQHGAVSETSDEQRTNPSTTTEPRTGYVLAPGAANDEARKRRSSTPKRRKPATNTSDPEDGLIDYRSTFRIGCFADSKTEFGIGTRYRLLA